MSETAATLVDTLLPAVPFRQWVFTYPVPLRLLFTPLRTSADQKALVPPDGAANSGGYSAIVRRSRLNFLPVLSGQRNLGANGSGGIYFATRYQSACVCERTCPMVGGRCQVGGVVHVISGGGGATTHPDDTFTLTK